MARTQPRLKYFVCINYRCKFCPQNFGDPERLRIPLDFNGWAKSVQAHMVLNHQNELDRLSPQRFERDKFGAAVRPINDSLDAIYS